MFGASRSVGSSYLVSLRRQSRNGRASTGAATLSAFAASSGGRDGYEIASEGGGSGQSNVSEKRRAKLFTVAFIIRTTGRSNFFYSVFIDSIILRNY
jgi:hypothetical protein